MNLNTIDNFYFIGIGGIGMSALARYFNAWGKFVCGYDLTTTALTDELISEGIEVHFEENVNSIPQSILNPADKSKVLIVYTPAVPDTNEELTYFKQNDFSVKKRAEVLSLITGQKFTIAVAGTHGKTTVSSMIAHILKHAGINCTAFLGGISRNYNTNLITAHPPNPSKKDLDGTGQVRRVSLPFGEGKGGAEVIFIVEADEYDKSFLSLHPDIAVITSTDADHLDIYGDVKHVEEAYFQFAKQIKGKGKLIIKQDLKLVNELHQTSLITYSLSAAEYFAKNIKIENGKYVFDIVTPVEEIRNIKLDIPGRHNMENAIAAIAVAQIMEIKVKDIKEAISSFKGVKRRFDYQVKTDDLIYIDDYAHHPQEITACIQTVRELYPNRRITGIFQPIFIPEHVILLTTLPEV
ncbi:MAG: Mur ligase family protein [Bacteroidota bacterium]